MANIILMDDCHLSNITKLEGGGGEKKKHTGSQLCSETKKWTQFNVFPQLIIAGIRIQNV